MQATGLRVERFHANYRVRSGALDPSSAQRQLDHIVRTELANAWQNIPQWRDESDAFVFIDQLEISISLDLSQQTESQIAAAWARQASEQISRAIRQGAAGVVVFHDHAERLVAFISDLLRGSPWADSRYAEFLSKRELPVGRVALECLCENPAVAGQVLLDLARQGSLEALLSELNNDEIRLLVAKCLPAPTGRIALDRVSIWIPGLRSILSEKSFSFSGFFERDLVSFYFSLILQLPDLGPDFMLFEFVRIFLTFRNSLLKTTARKPARDRVTLREALPAAHQKTFDIFIRQLRPPEIDALIDCLHDTSRPAAKTIFVTNIGGLFLLAATVSDLQIPEFLATLPVLEKSAQRVPALLNVLAVQCVGPEPLKHTADQNAASYFAGMDGISLCSSEAPLNVSIAERLREHLSKIVRGADRAAVEKYCGDNHPTQDGLAFVAEVILWCFAARVGFAGSSPAYVRKNFLHCPASIEVTRQRLHVRFLSCPLQAVLRMAGFDNACWKPSWLHPRQITFQFES